MSKFSEFREYVLSLPPDSRVAAPTHSLRVCTFPEFSPEAYIRLNNFPDDPLLTIMYDGQAEDFYDLNVRMRIDDTLEMPRKKGLFGLGGFGAGYEKLSTLTRIASDNWRWNSTDSEVVVAAEVRGKIAYLCGGEYLEGDIYSMCYDGDAIELSSYPSGDIMGNLFGSLF
ncbi:hypothetical protein [Terrimicrobium sacchariphilum]|nr:hypothetical protein [Terrimicrobium sacchariphilum]